jgi:preprotein translocase subunit SecG
MLGFFIGALTVILVIDCLFLILLVLVQLPKKEAGMGQAFGGAATDALFGAGSGNALTKLTKWAAGIFFALAIILTVTGDYATKKKGGGARLTQDIAKEPAATPPPSAAPAATPPPAAIGTNAPLNLSLPTNPAPAGATSAPAPAK